MYRIIMLSIMALALSSCSSMKKMASAVGKQAEHSDISRYTKSSFMEEYALSEDEYTEWKNIVESKAHEIFKANEAVPPDWQNGNQLYVGNNPLRVVTIPKSEVQYIELSVYSDSDPKVKMYLLDNGGIYFISNYQEYVGSNSGQKQYDKIFQCKYSNYESLARQYNDDLGGIGSAIAKESWQYLKPKKERKEQEEERVAKEAERLKKERIAQTLSDKRKSIEEQAVKIISEIENRKIKTLQLRELYLGMPAKECAVLLNYYLGLPKDADLECYEYNESENLILKGDNNFYSVSLGISVSLLPQVTENGQLSKLILSNEMIDSVFNASSLSAEEFSQALVNNYQLIKDLTPAQIEGTYSYGWKYSNPSLGFRITIDEKRNLLLEKIATSSDLTF